MKGLKEVDGLLMPETLVSASTDQKREIQNKCGPDGFINHLVPNHLLGLDISDSCNVHDWMFVEANNQSEHKFSDKTFLKNMKAQIRESKSNSVVKYMRHGLAYIYFSAVRIYSFFKKNVSQNTVKKPLK